MNSPKFFIGGIVGGIVLFFLGYLFYGILLKDFFATNGTATNMDTLIWWALVAGNLATGFLLSYVLIKSGTSSTGGAATAGFIVGLLVAAGTGLISYGTGHASGLKVLAADILTFAVMTTIAAAIITMVAGRAAKATTA